MSQARATGRGVCVICREPCSPRAENPIFPFCSRRCQLIDLARWLDGDYRIPSQTGDFDPGDSNGNGPESDAFM